jgi:hypothetical protein
MSTISLKHAKASFSSVVHEAPPRTPDMQDRRSLVEFLATFPVETRLDDAVFTRNPTPGRDVDL